MALKPFKKLVRPFRNDTRCETCGFRHVSSAEEAVWHGPSKGVSSLACWKRAARKPKPVEVEVISNDPDWSELFSLEALR